MTEADWLACTDPRAMHDHLKDTLSPRKFRLLLAAVARLGWDDLKDDRCREAIIAAEEHADGLISDEQLARANNQAERTREGSWSSQMLIARLFAQRAAMEDPVFAAWEIARWSMESGDPDRVVLLKIIREIVGNPFRPVSLDAFWLTANQSAAYHIAWGIYEERAFDQVSVLADALMDAGCDEKQLLLHLRSRGPHLQGCWALDTILGKS